MSSLNIFLLILLSDVVSMNKLKIISQCDIKHIITLWLNKLTSILNVSTYNIASITVNLSDVCLSSKLPLFYMYHIVFLMNLFIISVLWQNIIIYVASHDNSSFKNRHHLHTGNNSSPHTLNEVS